MKRVRLAFTMAAAAAVLVTGGPSTVVLASDDMPDAETKTSKARVQPSTKARIEPRANRDCRETVNDLPSDNNYLYLYTAKNCEGDNDAKDDSGGDSDYGDGEGQIKKFDNQAGSLINNTDTTIEFYTRPDYSKDGDRFCVRPGHYVTKLYMYGDGKQEAGNWSNSISSHRKVKNLEDCKRFFGWRIN